MPNVNFIKQYLQNSEYFDNINFFHFKSDLILFPAIRKQLWNMVFFK